MVIRRQLLAEILQGGMSRCKASKQLHKQQEARERGDFVTTEREAISSTKGKKSFAKKVDGKGGGRDTTSSCQVGRLPFIGVG